MAEGRQGVHAVAMRKNNNWCVSHFPASSYFQKCDPGNNGLCLFLIFLIWRGKTVTLANFTKEDLRVLCLRKKLPPSTHSQKVAKGQVGRQKSWQKVSQHKNERESRPNPTRRPKSRPQEYLLLPNPVETGTEDKMSAICIQIPPTKWCFHTLLKLSWGLAIPRTLKKTSNYQN